jgi:hypothetical protein
MEVKKETTKETTSGINGEISTPETGKYMRTPQSANSIMYLLESLDVHTPRLAAALSFRRKPESRKKKPGCRIESGMTKDIRYPVACCGVVQFSDKARPAYHRKKAQSIEEMNGFFI